MQRKVSIPHTYKLFLTVISFLIIQGICPAQLYAQNQVTLDLILQPQLNKAQVLSLSNIGITNSGGAPLFNLVISNDNDEPLNNLYLEMQVRSNRFGEIADIYQRSSYPFSLDAGQRVVATNKQLQNGLPGVEETIRFDGGITPEGEDFFNRLANATLIPPGLYTVTLNLYQGNNSRGGGELIASAEETFGENITTETSIDLYLLQPGGEVGSGEVIASTLPFFRWDGPTGLSYRLVVVEDNGQSPETLIQSALGTSVTLENGSLAGGTLLDYEIVDVRTSDVNFTLPPSGVQNLQAGKKYYWQVFTSRRSLDNSEAIPSEIWEFQVTSNETNVAATLNKEMLTSLRKILTPERLDQLRQQGFNFESIVIDGQTYEGAAAIQKLLEISNKIDDGEISIIVE